MSSIVSSSSSVPPSISNSENQLTVNEGESIRLSCEATGNPRPQIRWSKNGVRVDEFHSRYLVDETGSLTITSADAKDSAIYSCSALNIVGITEKRTSLFVQSALHPSLRRILTTRNFWYMTQSIYAQ